MRKFATFKILCLVLISLMDVPAVLAQVVFGPDQSAEAVNQLDTIVAVVDDDIITRRELEEALRTVANQLRQRGTPLPSREVLEEQVLERLIVTQLQLRAAERNGVVVDDQTVNAAMENLAGQNGLTLSQMRQILERDGFSFAKFREEMRRELLATRLRQRVVDSRIQITDQEVDTLLATQGVGAVDREYHLAQIVIAVPEGASIEQIEEAQKKALEVLEQLRQGSDFRELAVAVSDGRRALEGGDLGWRGAEQIPGAFAEAVFKLSPGEVSEPIRSPRGFHIIKVLGVKGGQGALVTQTHARHILIQTNELISDEDARLSLERLRERVINGEGFGDLARAHSNDTNSAVQGGDLGWISPGDLVPRFEQELSKLQPGEISEPFQTRFGWHIVQVLERRQHDNTTEAQRAAAREALFQRKVEEEWELWLRRLRDEAYVDIRL